MDPLLPSFRRELRARAHALDPVVSVGHHGLTPPVLHEIDVALTAHELIKVRVFDADRDQRDALLGRIVDALDCAPVQRIGKLLVLWRPRPTEDESPARRPARNAPRPEPVRARTAGKSAPPPAHLRNSGKAPARNAHLRNAGKGPPQIARVRQAGKAPAGVPRAAAPRRRRRAP